jgi:signal transduction histidine kinase
VKPHFNPPILAGIVGLVAVSLLAALAAMLIVTFRGPPPHVRPLLIDEVAVAIRTGQREIGEWRVERDESATPPAAPAGMRLLPPMVDALALRLGMPRENVRVYVALPTGGFGPPPGMRPDLRTGAPVPEGGFVPGREPWMGRMAPQGFWPIDNGFQGRPIILRDTFMATWLSQGRWQSMTGERHGSIRWYLITFSLMTLIFALLLIPAYLVARRITRPIQRLAEGVAAGSPDRADPFPVEGPPEVRRLAQAFNRMRGLLVGMVTERTAMLVAIAHDLRTPMTRLSFRLESLPDAERAKAQADVEEMRVMVTALLDFVRGDSDPVVLVRMDLSALVETLVDDMADMQRDVTIGDSARAVILGDAAALRRCIGNIIENAVRYGTQARLALRVDDEAAILTVDDNGPGISPELMSRICEPFYRGEQSRNRATGGVGLGLSIARTIADKHHGIMGFANRAEGGLRVTLRLPLAG